MIPTTKNRNMRYVESKWITALKTVLVALGLLVSFSFVLVGIPLYFVGLGREDTAGNYLRDKLEGRMPSPLLQELSVNGPEPNGKVPFQRRNIHWAYSPIDLMKLVHLEQNLYEVLRRTWNNSASKQAKLGLSPQVYEDIQRWTKDYEENEVSLRNMRPDVGTNVNGSQDSVIISHPFLSLRLMKRLSRLNGILPKEQWRATESPQQNEFFKRINFLTSQTALPMEIDVENIMNSILELQFVYDFHADELLKGKFGHMDTGVELSLAEARELGLYAYQRRMFPEALDWLQTVYTRLESYSMDTELNRDTVFGDMVEITKKHDELFVRVRRKNYYELYHRFTKKIISKDHLLTLKEEDTIRFLETNNTKFYPSYTLLCADKQFVPEVKRSKLSCWYERNSDLAWVINPLKMEVLSWDPYLVQIHEAFGAEVTEFLTEASVPNLNRASVNSENHCVDRKLICGPNATNPLRTFFQAILSERDEAHSRVLQNFARKVGQMTQLAVSNAGGPGFSPSEQLSISTYAFGGQFKPHLDTVSLVDENARDRLATFMVFLNNVQYGGYTVFPDIGISVTPQKGSALFWYNLFRNGTIDPRILHAGCPVVIGQKWVATKWLQLNANFEKRKCSTNSFE